MCSSSLEQRTALPAETEYFEIASSCPSEFQPEAIAARVQSGPDLRECFEGLRAQHRSCPGGSRIRLCIEHAFELFLERGASVDMALRVYNHMSGAGAPTGSPVEVQAAVAYAQFMGPFRTAADCEGELPSWTSSDDVGVLVASVAAAEPESAFSRRCRALLAARASATPS